MASSSKSSPTNGEVLEMGNTVAETGTTEATVVDEAEIDRTPKKDLTAVRYIGTSDVRSLSVIELARAGYEQKEDLIWDSQNEHTVDVKYISASTLEYLRSQPDFELA